MVAAAMRSALLSTLSEEQLSAMGFDVDLVRQDEARVKSAYGETAYDLAEAAFMRSLGDPAAKKQIMEVGVSTWLSERRQFMDTVASGGEFSDEDLAKWGTTIRDSIVGGLSSKFQGKTGDALTREVNTQLIDTIARLLSTNQDGFSRVEGAIREQGFNYFNND